MIYFAPFESNMKRNTCLTNRTRQVFSVAALFFFLSFGIPSILQASPIPSGQDVGATLRREKNGEMQRTILNKLSENEEEQTAIEDEDILQPEHAPKGKS